MILQNLQFPNPGENEKRMYMRYDGTRCVLDGFEKSLLMEKGAGVRFDTYFNIFAYEKWKKYTYLEDLRLKLVLKGCFEVTLIRLELVSDKICEYVLYSEKTISDKAADFIFVYPPCPAQGVLAFKLSALEEGGFYGGAYCTGIDEEKLSQVNLALCICTYKREDYIKANITMLKKKVFSDPSSMLKDHLYVYIADNGQTLKADEIEGMNIKLFPNSNSGGAGGFSRGIIESFEDREKHNLTHLVLMDDDVVFTKYTLERTYMFYRMLRAEQRNTMLGGAMLRLDNPSIQHTAGEMWTINKISSNKNNYKLYSRTDVLRNEIEESINYLAWWYCCFPMDVNTINNLAMPVFFQYDDTDFNLRNSGLKKITLAGICLWHDPFEKKLSIVKSYYSIRNQLIMCSLYGENGFTKFFFMKLIVWHVLQNILIYRYKAADMVLRAAEDYFKGFAWLTKVNPQELNDEITSMSYTFADTGELPVRFSYDEYKRGLKIKKKRRKLLSRIRNAAGFILMANRDVTAPADNPLRTDCFRAKRILNYDENTHRGFVTEKSIRESWRLFGRLVRILFFIGGKFKRTVKLYRKQYPAVITGEFWRAYLGIAENHV
ncbi:MAG: glycosyltransferase [Treponema sp.]|jgi:GT2 family glycosyltransferase|nr:glycosyltransferase [Treponema sp.]